MQELLRFIDKDRKTHSVSEAVPFSFQNTIWRSSVIVACREYSIRKDFVIAPAKPNNQLNWELRSETNKPGKSSK